MFLSYYIEGNFTIYRQAFHICTFSSYIYIEGKYTTVYAVTFLAFLFSFSFQLFFFNLFLIDIYTPPCYYISVQREQRKISMCMPPVTAAGRKDLLWKRKSMLPRSSALVAEKNSSLSGVKLSARSANKRQQKKVRKLL